MYFVAHDNMSRTACEEDIVGQVYEWAPNEALHEIDVLMGLLKRANEPDKKISALASQLNQVRSTTPLISFYADQAKLLQINAATNLELAALAASRDSIERILHSLHQTLPKSTSDSTQLPSIAETKRLTALLFLHERLGHLPDLVRTPATPAPSKSHIIFRIIALIKTLPNSPTLL